jgi:hypothetical protein
MKLEFVPLLQIQRDLYSIPRGQERFHAYLETVLNQEASVVELLPLVVMNPMGKDHLPALLDQLIALDVEGMADQMIREASEQLPDSPGEFKVGLVLADDRQGGWTNRYATEFTARFETQQSLKRGWLSALLWSSEDPSLQRVREAILTTVYRAAYIQQHGIAQTLGEMVAQEGYAMARAGCLTPQLEPEDLAYSYEIIAPHFLTQEFPMIMVCLFGDQAARSLGYKPQGLSESAGLALALHQARHHSSRSQ